MKGRKSTWKPKVTSNNMKTEKKDCQAALEEEMTDEQRAMEEEILEEMR